MKDLNNNIARRLLNLGFKPVKTGEYQFTSEYQYFFSKKIGEHILLTIEPDRGTNTDLEIEMTVIDMPCEIYKRIPEDADEEYIVNLIDSFVDNSLKKAEQIYKALAEFKITKL